MSFPIRPMVAAALCLGLVSCGYLDNRRNQKADRRLLSAEQAIAQGDFKRVVDECDEVIKLREDHVQAFALRGYASYCLGNAESALKDLNRAIQLDPSYPQAYRYRASVWAAVGLKDREADDRFAALALEGRNPRSRRRTGNLVGADIVIPGEGSVQPDGERAEELAALAEDGLAQDLMQKAQRLGGSDHDEVLRDMKDSIRSEGRQEEFRDLKEEALRYLEDNDPGLDELLE